jgi:hypothetical protein
MSKPHVNESSRHAGGRRFKSCSAHSIQGPRPQEIAALVILCQSHGLRATCSQSRPLASEHLVQGRRELGVVAGHAVGLDVQRQGQVALAEAQRVPRPGLTRCACSRRWAFAWWSMGRPSRATVGRGTRLLRGPAMCGRFTLYSAPKVIADLFCLQGVPNLAPRYNICPS